MPSASWASGCAPRCGCCTACTTARSWSLTARWVLGVRSFDRLVGAASLFDQWGCCPDGVWAGVMA